MKNTASHRNINFHLLHRRSSWSSRHQTMIFLTFPQVRSQVKIDMFPPLLSVSEVLTKVPTKLYVSLKTDLTREVLSKTVWSANVFLLWSYVGSITSYHKQYAFKQISFILLPSGKLKAGAYKVIPSLPRLWHWFFLVPSNFCYWWLLLALALEHKTISCHHLHIHLSFFFCGQETNFEFLLEVSLV